MLKDIEKPLGGRASKGNGGSPPLRLRMRLQTIDDVKRELARLYREARAGKVESQHASRMANMLFILSRLIEGSELEARLAALEEASQMERRR